MQLVAQVNGKLYRYKITITGQFVISNHHRVAFIFGLLIYRALRIKHNSIGNFIPCSTLFFFQGLQARLGWVHFRLQNIHVSTNWGIPKPARER